MALESPLEFDIGDDGRPVGESRETRPMRWVGDDGFGAYLKELRERAGWTTRQAAPKFDISQAYLSKMENAVRKRPPSLEWLKRVAEVYGCDLREVLHEAGFRFDVPADVDFDLHLDAIFAALMTHRRYRPKELEGRDLQFYSPRMKRQIVDLVLNVWRSASEGDDFDLEQLLEDGGAP